MTYHLRLNLAVFQGSVAYVPQEAWIRNDTLEKNVLFGKKKEAKKYNQALDACALRPDLQMLAAGDQTEIGEKVVSVQWYEMRVVIVKGESQGISNLGLW